MKFISFVFVFLACLNASALSLTGYLVEYDGSNEPVRAIGNPDRVEALYWKIKLFREGQPTEGNNHWGIIMEKTYKAAVQRLHDAQEAELLAREAMKANPNKSSWTYMNPLGPIGVLPSSDRERQRKIEAEQEGLQAVNELVKSVAVSFQSFNKAVKAVEESKNKDRFVSDPTTPQGQRYQSFKDTLTQVWNGLAKKSQVNKGWKELSEVPLEELRRITDETNASNIAFADAISKYSAKMDSFRTPTSANVRFVLNGVAQSQTLNFSGDRMIQELIYEDRKAGEKWAHRYIINANNLQIVNGPNTWVDHSGRPFFSVEVSCKSYGDCREMLVSEQYSPSHPNWQRASGGLWSEAHSIYFSSEVEAQAFAAKFPKR